MSVWAIGQASGVDTNVRIRQTVAGILAAATGATASGMIDTGGAVTRTSGMGLSVAPFQAYIVGTAAGQGGYVVVSDADFPLTIEDGSASARTDIVVALSRDNPYDASGFTSPTIAIVKGASGGPVPTTPLNAVKLAEQPVAAGVSAGTGGLAVDPVDKRPGKVGDTGWVAVPVGASWVSAGAQMRIKGGVVYMMGLIQTPAGNFAANSTITLISVGVLPAAFRPPPGAASGVNTVLSSSTPAGSPRGHLLADGSLVIVTGATTGNYVDLFALSGYVPG